MSATVRLLSIDEAAEALSVTPRMVRRLTSSRRLAFVKVGRLVRIREDDISRFVGDCTVVAVAHPAKRSW